MRPRSPDGKLLAAGAGHNLLICDAETGKVLKPLSGCEHTVAAVAWSADAKSVAAVGGEESYLPKYVCVWDVETGRLLNSWNRWTVGYTPVLRWLDKGTTLSMACSLDFVRWDTNTGQETLTPDEFSTKYGWKNVPSKATLKMESRKPKSD